MKSARHQFVLLGFVCQGMAWDGYAVLLFNVALWWLCLRQPRQIALGSAGENACLIVGSVLGYFIGQLPGQTPHFFIGHGLTFLQAARLLRPLSRREKIISIIAALVQLGVACTIVLDYRFILILGATFVLLPRVFMELEQESFQTTVTPPHAIAPKITFTRPKLGWRTYGVIAVAMVGLFLVFPRGLFGSAFAARRMGGGGDGSLVDSILDPSRSGLAQSGRILMQIEAETLGYLRCYAMVRFEDGKWSPDMGGARRSIPNPSATELARYQTRRVRVKSVNYLGRVLPTDGRVMKLSGGFFRGPGLNMHGLVETDFMWNSANNLYEYWIDPEPEPQRFSERHLQRFLMHPEPSARVRTWLDERLAGLTDPYEQAKILEGHFRQEFTYELGAPELDRLNHLDDFIFYQRRGHCERFASTLALLLREQDIPSRVVIGYVTNNRNWFSGWYNVRFRDAHAWTEAYFPERGWVMLDATPRGQMELPGWNATDIIDALDMVWYLHIVNFDAPKQAQFFADALQGLRTGAVWLSQRGLWVLLPVGVFMLVTWSRRSRKPPNQKISPLRQQQQWANHLYGHLLRSLDRAGWQREPSQTPREFLVSLAGHPQYAELERITDFFCETRYGEKLVSTEEQAAMEKLVGDVETALKSSRPNSVVAK